jgi:hypothetical protein
LEEKRESSTGIIIAKTDEIAAKIIKTKKELSRLSEFWLDIIYCTTGVIGIKRKIKSAALNDSGFFLKMWDRSRLKSRHSKKTDAGIIRYHGIIFHIHVANAAFTPFGRSNEQITE